MPIDPSDPNLNPNRWSPPIRPVEQQFDFANNPKPALTEAIVTQTEGDNYQDKPLTSRGVNVQIGSEAPTIGVLAYQVWSNETRNYVDRHLRVNAVLHGSTSTTVIIGQEADQNGDPISTRRTIPEKQPDGTWKPSEPAFPVVAVEIEQSQSNNRGYMLIKKFTTQLDTELDLDRERPNKELHFHGYKITKKDDGNLLIKTAAIERKIMMPKQPRGIRTSNSLRALSEITLSKEKSYRSTRLRRIVGSTVAAATFLVPQTNAVHQYDETHKDSTVDPSDLVYRSGAGIATFSPETMSRVVDTLNLMQDGNEDAIQAHAQEVINGGNYLTDVQIQEMRDSINEAKNLDELLVQGQTILNGYGRKLEVKAEDGDTERVRSILLGIVDGLSVLPLDYNKDSYATVKIFKFGSDADPEVAAYWSDSGFKEDNFIAYDLSNATYIETHSTSLHEETHADSTGEEKFDSKYLSINRENDDGSIDESRAEAAQDVGNGKLLNPKHHDFLTSKENESRVAWALSMEERYPGWLSVIIARSGYDAHKFNSTDRTLNTLELILKGILNISAVMYIGGALMNDRNTRQKGKKK